MQYDKKTKNRQPEDMQVKVAATHQFGDVVYFKYSNQSFIATTAGDVEPIQWVGFMGGDGLANDRLDCLNRRIVGEQTVTQFLFRVEPARKYFQKEAAPEEEARSLESQRGVEEKLREAENEEKDYQENLKNMIGTPIYYGQNLLLRHIFSGCYVTLHSDRLSKQVGSVKVGLQEVDTESSIMQVIPSSRIKKMGDTVSYADAILISNSKEDHYFLHVSEYLNTFDKGLEINGSETRTEWKPKLYVSDQKDNFLMSKSSVVTAGVVLSIYNHHVNGYLSASPKKLEQISRVRELRTKGTAASQNLRNIGLDFVCMEDPIFLEHEVIVEIRPRPSFYTLWEVQRLHLFDSDPIVYFKESHAPVSAVKIKNVATQQYLCVDPRDDSRLCLHVNSHLDSCVFYFESKSGVSENSVVSTEDLLKIRTHKGKFLFPNKIQASKDPQKPAGGPAGKPKSSGQASDNEKEYEFRVYEKIDTNSSTFELISKPKELTKVANQLACLFSSLMSFYTFLQEWGKDPSSTPDLQHFDYDTAVETEKELEIHVQELEQSLRMIYLYLSSEVSAKGNLTKFSELRSVRSSLLEEEQLSHSLKKQLLIEQNIMDVLFQIAELIVFKAWASLRTWKVDASKDGPGAAGRSGDKDRELISMNQLYFMGTDKSESLPQLVARKRLRQSLLQIFKIMHLSVWDNEDCSNYLALKFKFFQNLIDFFPKESMNVMKEVAKNITNQEEEYIMFYEPWIQMLEEISHTKGNIKKQIFLLNTLSGLILDETDNSPIEVFQTRIFESFFQRAAGSTAVVSKGTKSGFLRFELSTGNAQKGENSPSFKVCILPGERGRPG